MVLNLLSALAVSSTILVSRSPHRANSICLEFSEDREDMGGVGRRELLKDDASSSRVSFISDLRRTNGCWIIAFRRVRSSSSDGIDPFRRTRDCSKSFGMVTFSSRDKAGMENSGMEMSIPMSEVARCSRFSIWLKSGRVEEEEVSVWRSKVCMTHADPRYCLLNYAVGGGYARLDGRSDLAETSGNSLGYLSRQYLCSLRSTSARSHSPLAPHQSSTPTSP